RPCFSASSPALYSSPATPRSFPSAWAFFILGISSFLNSIAVVGSAANAMDPIARRTASVAPRRKCRMGSILRVIPRPLARGARTRKGGNGGSVHDLAVLPLEEEERTGRTHFGALDLADVDHVIAGLVRRHDPTLDVPEAAVDDGRAAAAGTM